MALVEQTYSSKKRTQDVDTEVNLLEERYSSMKNHFERFEELMDDRLLETKGELLWCLNELRSGVRKVTESINDIENSNNKDSNSKDRKKLLKKAHVLLKKVIFLIESPEVKERLGDQYFTFRPSKLSTPQSVPDVRSNLFNTMPISNTFVDTEVPAVTPVTPVTLVTPVTPVTPVSTVRTEERRGEHFDEISILEDGEQNESELGTLGTLGTLGREGREDEIDDRETFLKTSKEKHHKNIRMSNFKVKLLNGLTWMRKNPKKIAIAVAVTVGVIIVLVIIL